MDISQNHFDLFGLSACFQLDGTVLEHAYHRAQGEVHPDRFASDSSSSRRVAMQWATRVNEAYATLKDPLSRARYLCELGGVDLEVESNTSMPQEFLIEQMQWHEALDDARDSANAGALEGLAQQLGQAHDVEIAAIAAEIDQRRNFAAAAIGVRRLMFLERVREDVERAIDALIV